MKEIESISSALFDKIRSRFANISLGDEKAKDISDPSKARFFNFNYKSNLDPHGGGELGETIEDKSDKLSTIKDKIEALSSKLSNYESYKDEKKNEDFGNITISLIDETSLKVYYSQNITHDMNREQRKEWYEFLRNLRQFAKRNLLTFDTRDINKSNLKLQDIKQQAKVDDVATLDDVKITESKINYSGTLRTSKAQVGESTLLIRHTDQINPEVRGARTRHINEIFLQTSRGERFLLDHTSLTGAIAQASHINGGGNLGDEIGESLKTMIHEMNSMRHFVREAKRRQFEDVETAGMKDAAIKHFNHLKETLKSLRSPRGYTKFVESFVPNEHIDEDYDVEEVKERFVKKIYDSRFDEALPIVIREYKRQQAKLQNMVSEFSDWAEELTENVYAKPSKDDVEKIKHLQDMLNAPIKVGIDARDVLDKLEEVGIGDTELESDLVELAGVNGQGPDADATQLIKTWLRNYTPDLYRDLHIGKNNGRDAQTNWAQPVSPAMDNHEYADEKGGWGNTDHNMTY